MDVSVATKADLTIVNPIDYDDVFVEEEGATYHFEYTSKAEPNGEDVLPCGSFASDHPTHADQPFMSGCWHKQA